MNEVIWKNPWSDRFLFLEKHIPDNVSIVDFGCGNKQILDYCNPREYLGIDICDDADLKINLNEHFSLDKKYDLGLILGVLEHVIDPEFTLQNCIQHVDKLIILTSSAKMKAEWLHAFDKNKIQCLLQKYFSHVDSFIYPRYVVCAAERKL